MDDLPKTQLFVPSKWKPDHSEIPRELVCRVDQFSRAIKQLFVAQQDHSNLLPSQQRALRELKARKDLIVLKTDKNLGPAIVEREVYIRKAFEEHLGDPKTYRRLTETQANQRIKAIIRMLDNFNIQFFPNQDRTTVEGCNARFLRHWVDQFRAPVAKDPFSYFYLLAKIHKNPWKTRPIVSYSGSILHGLGRWLDTQLQLICKELPYFLSSSRNLVKDLSSVKGICSSTRLFSCDAVSMYTNINTKHALDEITAFLQTSPIPKKLSLNTAAIIRAIDIIMNHNVFRFGDTYWVQLCGTAMGTPPAPMYATLYFAIHEYNVIIKYPELLLYRRYIDDGLGIWKPLPTSDPTVDLIRWEQYQSDMNNYGSLSWEFTERTLSIPFLDITISIEHPSLEISFTLFQKQQNLYLYLPAHTAHPPGVLKGLVHGMYYSTKHLNSDPRDIELCCQRFLDRMTARGHSRDSLLPILDQSIQRFSSHTLSVPNLTEAVGEPTRPVFLHIKYHPSSPSSRKLQEQFCSHLRQPPGETPLPVLTNLMRVPIGINRMIVAYHRPKNLGDILTPRKISEGVKSVSTIIDNPDI